MPQVFRIYELWRHLVVSTLFVLRDWNRDHKFVCLYNQVCVLFNIRVDDLIESLLLLAFLTLPTRLSNFGR